MNRTARQFIQRATHGPWQGMEDDAKKLLAPRPRTERERAAVKAKRQKQQGRREARAVVYAEVDRRSGGRCEHERVKGEGPAATEHDHFWGRGKAVESAATVWHLCAHCHRRKTHNIPSRRFWLEAFQRHCYGYGYTNQIYRVAGALALETAQHPAAPEREDAK